MRNKIISQTTVHTCKYRCCLLYIEVHLISGSARLKLLSDSHIEEGSMRRFMNIDIINLISGNTHPSAARGHNILKAPGDWKWPLPLLSAPPGQLDFFSCDCGDCQEIKTGMHTFYSLIDVFQVFVCHMQVDLIIYFQNKRPNHRMKNLQVIYSHFFISVNVEFNCSFIQIRVKVETSGLRNIVFTELLSQFQ